MRKIFLLIPVLVISMLTKAAIPELTKSDALTLTAASEGFEQSDNAKALEDGEWINWPGGTIHEGFAKWRVNVANSGMYAVTLDMKCTNTYKFRACVINPTTGDTIAIGRSAKVDHGTYANPTEDCGTFNLIGLEAGEYYIAVTDTIKWSEGKVRGMTLNYLGADELEVEANTTINGADAVVVGAMSKLSNGDLQSSGASDLSNEYAYWYIDAAKSGSYEVSFIGENETARGHRFAVGVYSNLNASALDEVAEASNSWKGATVTFTETLEIPAKGKYYIKLSNSCPYSSKVVSGLTLKYLGGNIMNVPDTLWPVDALRSSHAQLIHGAVDTLTFARLDHEWEADDPEYTIDGCAEYVKWNVYIPKDGKYQFVANTFCKQGHNYRIILYTENEASLVGSWLEKEDATKYDYHENMDWKVSTPVLDLTEGKYVIKMQAREYGRVMYVAANYEGGAVTDIPGQLLGEDAVIYDNGHKKMFHNANGDLEYDDNGTPTGEYAYWFINATEAEEMVVSFNSPSGGHNFLFELYEGTTLRGSVSEEDSEEIWEHNVTLADHLTIPATGSYTLRVHNRTQWSSAVLHSVTLTPYVAPAVIAMSENDADNSAWAEKVVTDPEVDNPVNVTIDRTILAGMYNTLCLPFPVSSTQCKAIFGDDVELLTFAEATISGDILTLSFNDADDIYQGTPMLIKTSANVVTPTFNNVTFKVAGPDATHGTAADFKGIFFPTQLDASTDLFVGQGNQVHFPSSTSAPLKGLRAYFRIKAQAGAVKRARIVANEQVITEIDLVNGENSGLIKTLENGQLIINLDGIRYNVMGTQIR